MPQVRASSLSELARLGFESLSETLPKLDTLIELVGDNGRSALAALAQAASPDRALDALIGLARQNPKQLAKLLSKSDLAGRVIRILGASDALAEYLIRRPELLENFSKSPSLPTQSELATLPATDVNGMRAGYREQLIRIVDFDLAQQDFSSVGLITKALSDLASGAMQAGLALARAELKSEGRYSEEEINRTSLAVIAMGKCGARELNYLSDVDVIYVAAGESESYLDIATRLATKLQRITYEPEQEAGLWQIDPNLRPEGKQGALVRSLEGHLGYYQKWAESWEFQALLKARFVAGDAELGEKYIATIKPLIWQADRSSIVESARHLRKRVLDLIPQAEREREIKLGRGGLRDVEFTAQLMQLVHGVSDETLRVMDTFSALDALAAAGHLARADRDTLTRNYQFLRTLEHRVQLSKLKRSHLLPEDPSELRRIARSMGMSETQLSERWDIVRSETAALHDSVFYRPLLQAAAALSPDEVRLSDEEVLQRLSAIGFVDPAGANQHIAALTQGVSRRSVIQRTLLPVLLRWMAEGSNPDRALLSFRRLSESLGESHWFLRMLRDSSGAAERLMRVLSTSAFISRLLENIPDSSQWFGDEAALKPLDQEQIEQEMKAIIERGGLSAAESLRQIRRREVLRVAIGAVLGANSLSEISAGLSQTTEAYLRAMLSLAKASIGTDLDVAIIAMGRFGGAELGFGSDADVILVYRSEDESAPEIANQLVSELLQLVRDSLLDFELDLDLRPEGKNGPRIRSISGYRGYYEKWADAWEFQALLRARPISGSDELRTEFLELIDQYRYPPELPQKQVIEIRRIKARVETERLPQGADPARHLKLGRGSLSDVEWLVQLYQLRYAHKHPSLRTLGTIRTLDEISSLGLAESADIERLKAGWLIASRARSAQVLALDKSTDTLPADTRELDVMARILEYQPGQGSVLEQDYLAITRRARASYEKLFYS